MQTQGKKEVAEAVAIAALTALATGLINLSLKVMDDLVERRQRKGKKKKRDNG